MLSARLLTVLTAYIEVIVSCDDHIGCCALLWLGGMNGVTEQLTLGGREGGGLHIQVGHDVVDADAQVFDDLQLVVGVPEVACRGRGSQTRQVVNHVLQAKCLFSSLLNLVTGTDSTSEMG